MKLLLLGCQGQVGRQLQRSLAPLGEVVALHRQSTPYCGDLANAEGMAATVRQLRPDVIVNAAAYNAVDHAERDVEQAYRINAAAVGVLAQEACALGALLAHYSTDYVFDGSGTKPWDEQSPAAPLSVYGQSKLQGEQLIQSSGCRHLIFRTSWVYAAHGNNFVKAILRLAQARERWEVVNDQWGAPTGADWLADITALAIQHVQQHPEHLGLYHCVSQGAVNRYDYARYVLSTAQQMRPDGAWKVASIQPMSSAAFAKRAGHVAQRPLNSRLSTAKLQRCLGVQPPPWQPGVQNMLQTVLHDGGR